MSYIFKKYPNRPLQRSNGVYLIDNNLTDGEMGELNGWNLDTGKDREKFSLGNWNSKVRNNIKIVSPHNKDIDNLITAGGRPIRLRFKPKYVVAIYDIFHENYSGINHNYDIFHENEKTPEDEARWGDSIPYRVNTLLFWQLNRYRVLDGWPSSLRNTFLTDGELKDDLQMNYTDGFGYIQERTEQDIEDHSLRIKLDPNLRAIRERILNTVWQGVNPTSPIYDAGEYLWSGGVTCRFQLYFGPNIYLENGEDVYHKAIFAGSWDSVLHTHETGSYDTFSAVPEEERMISIVNPLDLDGVHKDVPIMGWDENNNEIISSWTTEIDTSSPHSITEQLAFGGDLGYPYFSVNATFPTTTDTTLDPVDFKVACFTSTDYTDHGKFFEVLTDESKNIINGGEEYLSEVGYEWFCYSGNGEIERKYKYY